MPRLSDSMEEGTILKWLVSEGDEVKRGQPIAEIETDKANMTYEADTDGTVSELVASEGDTLADRRGDRADRRGRTASRRRTKEQDEPSRRTRRRTKPRSRTSREPEPEPEHEQRATSQRPARTAASA